MPRTVRKGLGRYRLAQLRSDLKLTPEARVLEAEEPTLEHLAAFDLTTARSAPKRRTRVSEGRQPVPADQFATKLALVCSVLNDAGAHYVVVGARALQLWGTSRFTKDTDILIEKTLPNAERVLAGLSRIGFGVAADFTAEEVVSRHVTIIGDTPSVDILTRAWNLTWREAAPRAVTFTVEGVTIPTACIEDLIASKRTSRLQDLADIEVLEAIQKSRTRKSR
ncbi:MAG: nucleotidyltransferase [Gemmatimonadota bacterium]|nr:nucleotidyltransferase [Gemmatimonadota bacterium]